MVRSDNAGDLPWGWWLRMSDGALEDEDGRRWHSVRDAFWHGHLRFPGVALKGEQQELLLRILNAIDRRDAYGQETMHDLLGGDLMYWRFYRCWLASVGLTAAEGDRNVFDARLSGDGRSVMLMLRATRDPDWIDLPFADIVEAIGAADRDAPGIARETALRAFERSVARRPHVFARERIGGSHVVTLTGMATAARMPTRSVMWSHPFAASPARDDFFGWLAGRVDRWDDWTRLAYERGASALTQHLLTLVLEGGGWPS
ncbi:hypothetical protein IFT82_16765 [Sphingomonas sp. CFBP 8760]|nr:hypothetical protein [Sphingomonas sp. CFBP 8760]